MQVDYIHGNPTKGNFKVKKPTASQLKQVWGKEVADKLAKASNPVKKKAVAKKATKITKKVASKKSKNNRVSSTSVTMTLDEAKKLLSSDNKKSQGGSTMAKKKPMSKAKRAEFAARMKAARAAKAGKKAPAKKKAAKKVAKKIAKKAVRKVAVKKVAARKAAPKRKVAKKASRKGVSALRHAVAMRKAKAQSHSVKAGRDTYGRSANTRNTKMPMPVRLLKRGEVVEGTMTRVIKRKKKNGKHTTQQRVYEAKIIRTNPKKKRNPVIVSANPKKKKYGSKKKNPLVVSRNPRSVSFLNNPMGSVVAMEAKLLKAVAPVDNITKKFLNVGVLEIAGLGVGASFDGLLHSLVLKIPGSDKALAYIPEEYQAPAIMGGTGVLLHLVNSFFIAKKGGKESVVLAELSKGMIAAAIVKSLASLSKFSAENESLAGYQYTPSKTVAGLGGYIQSNPSASMKVGNSDFSGADFQGADFQGHTDNVGGADFDGYVTTMGDEESMDFGTDKSSMAGNW